jgi:SAM-dependent methyltransferase
MDEHFYMIRGGIEGRERLRVLARVMRPGTLSLFERAGVGAGQRCLDVGCGGGDVTVDLAAAVGITGSVVGVDIDPVKIELARADAEQAEMVNVEFRVVDVATGLGEAEYDVVYARFVLWTLSDPEAAMRSMLAALKPGGRLIVEDIDFRGSGCYPESAEFERACEIFIETARRMGGDARFGRRVPRTLLDAGLEGVQTSVVHPGGLEGEVKVLHPLSLENIKASVVAQDVATADEVDRLVDALYELARDPTTYMLCPRIVQAWGDKPTHPAWR